MALAQSVLVGGIVMLISTGGAAQKYSDAKSLHEITRPTLLSGTVIETALVFDPLLDDALFVTVVRFATAKTLAMTKVETE